MHLSLLPSHQWALSLSHFRETVSATRGGQTPSVPELCGAASCARLSSPLPPLCFEDRGAVQPRKGTKGGTETLSLAPKELLSGQSGTLVLPSDSIVILFHWINPMKTDIHVKFTLKK